MEDEYITNLLMVFSCLFLGVILTGWFIATIEDWWDERKLKKLAKSPTRKARPRWFSNGDSDL